MDAIIYNDANPEQIETLAPNQPHHPIDLEIINAEKDGMYYAATTRRSYLLFLIDPQSSPKH
jgi:hypothetical protein